MNGYDRYPAPPRRSSLGIPILVLLLLAAVLVWRMETARTRTLHNSGASQRLVSARGDLADDEKATIALFGEASPAVVFITTSDTGRDRVSLNLFDVPRGSGSGFVWDDAGYIVTNYHVAAAGHQAQVILHDQSIWRASLVAAAPDRDIAVLKIDAPPDRLRPILVGSSHDLRVGQKVFAIGNPFGFDQTLTTGIISGLDREITTSDGRKIDGVIQTDAAINPGNSGGPLLDSAARLIGMNTAILSPSGAYAGIGFAVPVDDINAIVPQLISGVRSGFGIKVLGDHLTKQLGIKGVIVVEAPAGSAGAAAGLRPTPVEPSGLIRQDRLGDIIVAVEGERVENMRELGLALSHHAPGESVRLTVTRDGTELDLNATLQALPLDR